jgi:hypothetical protein
MHFFDVKENLNGQATIVTRLSLPVPHITIVKQLTIYYKPYYEGAYKIYNKRIR